MDCLSRTKSDAAEIRLKPFVLGFLGLLCAMAIGFMLSLRQLAPNSGEYGYDERLVVQSLSASGDRMSNCLDDGAAIAGACRDGSERLAISALFGQSAMSSTKSFAEAQ